MLKKQMKNMPEQCRLYHYFAKSMVWK